MTLATGLFGIDRADEGEIKLDGKRVSFHTPSQALGAGIAYVPEDRHLDGLVTGFSIAEKTAGDAPNAICFFAPEAPREQ